MENNTTNPRKEYPVYSGVLKYFPDALLEVSNVSLIGNAQHKNGEELRWDRDKSSDELDAMMRHLIDHAKGDLYDECGTLHIAKCGWRILAYIQKHIELQIKNK